MKALFAVFLLFQLGCSKKMDKLENGYWRLTIKGQEIEIPAIIEVVDENNIFLHRGQDKFRLDKLQNDSQSLMSLGMHIYDSQLSINEIQKDFAKGEWVRNDKNPVQKYSITLERNKTQLFDTKHNSTKHSLDGKWRWTFEPGTEKESVVLAIFQQDKNQVVGSVATPTGDYGYSMGYISENEFKLSTFDGVFAFIIQGKFDQNQTSISGELISLSGKRSFTAIKDDLFKLPDPTEPTKVTRGQNINFALPSVATGKVVTLSDSRYKDKAVILQIYGSWCPNCLDEVRFLSKWYNENKDSGVEVIALAFEKAISVERAKANILKSIATYSIQYEFLLASFDSSIKPDKILPIENFISYPTTLFLNKKHEVVKIHAGFSGPATGGEYDQFLNFFITTVEQIK